MTAPSAAACVACSFAPPAPHESHSLVDNEEEEQREHADDEQSHSIVDAERAEQRERADDARSLSLVDAEEAEQRERADDGDLERGIVVHDNRDHAYLGHKRDRAPENVAPRDPALARIVQDPVVAVIVVALQALCGVLSMRRVPSPRAHARVHAWRRSKALHARRAGSFQARRGYGKSCASHKGVPSPRHACPSQRTRPVPHLR